MLTKVFTGLIIFLFGIFFFQIIKNSTGFSFFGKSGSYPADHPKKDEPETYDDKPITVDRPRYSHYKGIDITYQKETIDDTLYFKARTEVGRKLMKPLKGLGLTRQEAYEDISEKIDRYLRNKKLK